MTIEPSPDCALCPRLAAFRLRNRAAFVGHHNAPVRSFGPLAARLLVVGLAPGLHGANRTGRPFTGDAAGELLYPALIVHGFMRGTFGASPDDGLEAIDARITNAARCVPPRNRPSSAEIAACNRFLAAEIAAMPRLTVVLALGAVAHGAVLRALGERPSRFPFRHGVRYDLPRFALLGSYHCSRLNTNTGRLTPGMFDAVVRAARAAVTKS